MKQIKEETESLCLRSYLPQLPLAGSGVRKIGGESITNKQIKKFWRQKQITEEDHLFAAIKAAARVRARKLSEEEYKCFEESLDLNELEIRDDELHVGIKDWWTKSKYAYLNQPALGLGPADSKRRRRRFSYVPNCFSFKTNVPLYPTSLNVF
ncbi:PREDICTED: uncharacterized protein LOC104819731 [Tarenaya hassleriana]|uniref:uncharacterized protein LOC104819731 n=1 Tax=Tarenaya hassleriana TaxID=28532 RepID=UPI00053CA4A6|nr:PREDICTED: uncharacterized protein LOC104819731 [Tarenaya hassleriana]